MKILPVGDELFHADRQRGRQRDMTKLTRFSEFCKRA